MCAIVAWVLQLITIRLGFGKHVEYVELSNIAAIIYDNFILQGVWIWGVTMVKVSLGFMILRIMRSKSWKWFIYIIMGLIVGFAVASNVVQLTQCVPIRANWDFTVPHAKCRSHQDIAISVYISSSKSCLKGFVA
jgi:hypothetical protein